MSNIKISQLTSALTLAGIEPVPVVQGGNTVKTTAQDIANLAIAVGVPNSWTGSSASQFAGTASFALTASHVLGGGGGSTSGLLTTASFNTYTSSISSQFAGTASFATSASRAVSASFATTASYVLGGGGGAAFPYNGNAVITGSLLVSGSVGVTGSLIVASSADTNQPFRIGADAANIRILYPLPGTQFKDTNWNKAVYSGPNYTFAQAQFPILNPYFSGGGGSSGGGNTISTVIGHLGIGNYTEDIIYGTSKLEALFLHTQQTTSPDPGSDAIARSAVRTIISDNDTISTSGNLNTTVSNAYTANGRTHVLTVTGSMLARDGVSLGTNISNSHIVTGSVAITGSVTIDSILKLQRRTTTPTSPEEGMIIASGSVGASVLYYYNGSSWNALF